MPLIAGLDIAKACGVAFVDMARPPSSWRCLTLRCDGKQVCEIADDFDKGLRDLFTRTRPDFVAMEQPLDVIPEYGDGSVNAVSTILLNRMFGRAEGILAGMGIPFGHINVRTWRRAYYGSGFKPPSKVVKKKLRNGTTKEVVERDWKAAAINHANLQRILLPSTKADAHNAAEAVGIAVAWTHVGWIPPRFHDAFKALRTGQPPQADMFRESA